MLARRSSAFPREFGSMYPRSSSLMNPSWRVLDRIRPSHGILSGVQVAFQKKLVADLRFWPEHVLRHI